MQTQIKKTKHTVLGIMSGTSLDGVDYALCEITPQRTKLKKVWSVTFPKKLKSKILAAASNWLSSYEVCELNHELGRFYAENAPNAKFDYIGLHGQTIFHQPLKPHVATSQIGEPAYLAARFRKPVVNQFRTMDLALGGQGAPLATFFHTKVFGHPNLTVAVNNLGGISNVTYLPAGKHKSQVLSFDTGPANMLIDYAVARITKNKKSFDDKGIMASLGLSHQGLIQKWLKNKFFLKAPPKSTGREDFGQKYFELLWKDCQKLSNVDIVATFTDFTAQSIALNYAKHLPHFPQRVILCGGGASNPTLQKMIRQALRKIQWERNKKEIPVEVLASDDLGWPANSIEASAFALLAYQNMTGQSGNLPVTTGARHQAILGSVTPAPY
jgi:anhydro-N-acetylmuramic acid kinase